MVIANAIGIGGMPGSVPDDGDQSPSLVTLFTLTATVLLFSTNQHWELLRGLVDSYRTIPVWAGDKVDTCSETWWTHFSITRGRFAVVVGPVDPVGNAERCPQVHRPRSHLPAGR